MKRTTRASRYLVMTRCSLACGSTARRSPDTSATGLHAYDLRDCDDCSGDPCQLKSYVMVNHWGTVVTRDPIGGAGEGIALDKDDYNYLGENMTLDEFANSAPTMEQTM